MNTTKATLISLSAAAVVAATIAIPQLAAREAGSSSAGALAPLNPRSSNAVPAANGPAPAPSSSMPPRARATLEEHGIVLQEERPGTGGSFGRLTAQQAVQRARQEFGLREDQPVAGATPGRLSTPGYGREREPNPNKPSRIDPMYIGHPAWVVTLEDVEMQQNGPMAAEAGSENATGTMVVILDASTGEFIWAIAY